MERVGIRRCWGSCRSWLRSAAVSGPLRPGCPRTQRDRQTDRGGGNPIAQPSPSLMSVYRVIYPCVYLSGFLADWLLDAAYLHAGYSSVFTASGRSLQLQEVFPLPFIYFVLSAQTSLGRIKAAIYESPSLQD